MPNDRMIALAPAGLAPLDAAPDRNERSLIDCDRYRRVGQDSWKPWPGCARVGERLFSTTNQGAAVNELHIVRFDKDDFRLHGGHGLAVVDRSSNTQGRVLGLGYNADGLDSDKIVGVPLQVNGSGLSDIRSRGPYSGAGVLIAIKITTAASTDQFDYSTDGGSTYSGSPKTMDKTFQSLVDGILVKFDALTGHTLNDVWKFYAGSRPSYAGSLYRISPHQYATIVGGRGDTAIFCPFNQPRIDIGAEILVGGLPAPHIAPVVRPAVGIDFDIGDTDNASPTWTAAVGGVAVNDQTSPTPASGNTRSLEITIPHRVRVIETNLAYRDLSSTINANVKVISFNFFVEGSRGELAAGTIGFTVNSATALGGTATEFMINVKVPIGRWVPIDIAWTPTVNTAYLSIGIIKKSVIPREFFDSDGHLKIYIDDLRVDGDGANDGSTVPSTMLNASDVQMMFAFTWFDRRTQRESAPSPASPFMELRGVSIEVGLDGAWSGMPVGLANEPPADVDPDDLAVHMYMNRSDWGFDPRLTATSDFKGRPQFFRITQTDGIPYAQLIKNTATGSVTGTAIAEGNLEGLKSWPGTIAVASWTLTATATPTIFGVDGDGETYDDATVDEPYDNGMVRFIPRETGTFTNGLIFEFATTTSTFSDGTMVSVIGDENLQALVRSATNAIRDPFWASQLPSASLAIDDGDIIVMAGLDAYHVSSGSVVTNGSFITTPNGATVFDTWMEDREVQWEGDDRVYIILKYIPPNGTYANGALYFGSDFDPDVRSFTIPYEGASGTKVMRILPERRRIYWTNTTDIYGPDRQSSSIFNTLVAMPEDDQIEALARIGPFLYAIGSNNTVVFNRNSQALSDDPVRTGLSYFRADHLKNIGILGPRYVASHPDGSAMWVTPRGEIYHATGSIPQKHPSSKALTAFLSGYKGIINGNALKHGHVTIKVDGDDEYLIISLAAEATSENEAAPGVTSKHQDLYDLSSSTSPFTYSPATDCVDIGGSVDTDALSSDFEYQIMVDLIRGEVYLASNSPFTCHTQVVSGACTVDGQMFDGLFYGDRHGYITRALESTLLSWGSPDSLIIFPFSSGGNTTFTISNSIAGGAWTKNLARDADNVSKLIGLAVCKFTPSTKAKEYRRITAATDTQVTVSLAWTSNPVTDDLLIIAPLPALLHWSSIRTIHRHWLDWLRLNLFQDDSPDSNSSLDNIDTNIDIDLFTDATAGIQANRATVAQSQVYDKTDIEAGTGRLQLLPAATRATQLRITALGPQNAPFTISGVVASLTLSENEEGL